jgi:glyoxylase-like metal-dependent hydrolase (beta-lactamase superfamily II)
VGERHWLPGLVKRAGLKPQDIKAILLTHGHLDHAGNLAWLREWSQAPVYAHPLEALHLQGAYSYTGTARICGLLEGLGRRMLDYRPVSIDRIFEDGEELPFWGGLQVVHLPGHTDGHCGFYSKKRRLLFSGDLFASFFYGAGLPPVIFNSNPHLIPTSLEKARQLRPGWVIPNHYDIFNPSWHRKRFDRLCRKILDQRDPGARPSHQPRR